MSQIASMSHTAASTWGRLPSWEMNKRAMSGASSSRSRHRLMVMTAVWVGGWDTTRSWGVAVTGTSTVDRVAHEFGERVGRCCVQLTPQQRDVARELAMRLAVVARRNVGGD